MTSPTTHEQHLPLAARVLPFFLTAPIAVAVAGGMLIVFGKQVFSNNWSPLTMGLTHLATLGFLSMTLIGSFYLLVPLQLDRRIKAPRLPYFVHALFTIAVGALCLGLSRVAVTPVFVAIAAFFLALCAFFWPAIAALRGTRDDPRANPLRLAIGSFLIAASIGIWVAHGHGAMKFPGPRGLWIQVHLSIALFGWVGGMAKSAFDLMSGSQTADIDNTLDMIEVWWGRLVTIGVVASTLLLALQYTGLLDLPLASATWTRAAAGSPLLIAGCALQPLGGLRKLRNPSSEIAQARFWRTAFWLAPISLLIATVTLVNPAPQWRMAFGWVALWGWAGLMVHAVLRELPRRLFAGDSPREGSIEKLAYPLHLLSLVAGLVAIATGSPSVARMTGIVLLALALQQACQIVGWVRIERSVPPLGGAD